MTKLEITSNDLIEIEIEEEEEMECHSVDIFKIINGIYPITDKPYATLEIEDVNESYEIDMFCYENNCYYVEGKDDILYCKKTDEPRFFIR